MGKKPRPASAAPKPAWVRVQVDLPLSNRRWQAELQVPAGRTPAADLWPLFAALADAVAQWSLQDAAAAGRPATCASGCAACCRHMVPVSAVELAVLHEAWRALPEPARQAVAERLARATAALRDSGLARRLQALDQLDEAGLRALIRDYFALQLDCPFLEGSRCAVYAQRPMACREQLVDSPPAACEDPSAAGVNRLPLPAESVGRALRVFNGPGFGAARGWRPMVLALAAPQAAHGVQRDGPDQLRSFFEAMLAQRPDAAAPSPASNP